jgi:transposase
MVTQHRTFCKEEDAAMMGVKENQRDLFSYHVDLDKRVRQDHPLRKIQTTIDFNFVRQEVADRYGYNGNVSVDPAVILKMMFLLFYDDVVSERELMKIIPERLDYLWFLGYGLDEEVPDHSVLSKARKRWGVEVFEGLFVRVVGQCVRAGLVEGKKIHVDASLIDANASKDSVFKGSPELIMALKTLYQVQEKKLESTTPDSYQAVNERMMSTTDPDTACVRKGGGDSARPRYHHHRVVDNAQGVITAMETTSGSVAENLKLMDLVSQHEGNTGEKAETVVADRKYGTAENYVACQQKGLTTHMADVASHLVHVSREGIFPEREFRYDEKTNTYICPAGQVMRPRRLHPRRRTWEYLAGKQVCLACVLRCQCSRASYGRTVHRHEYQALLDRAREQAHSREGRRDRLRRQHLMEQSFADATNNHGFKRSRWRRLWRQKIQDYMIAAIQNIRILISHIEGRKNAAVAVVLRAIRNSYAIHLKETATCFRTIRRFFVPRFLAAWPPTHSVTT